MDYTNKKEAHKMKTAEKIVKYAFLVMGVVIFLNAVVAAFTSNFNLGLVVAFLLGISLIVLGLFKGLKLAVRLCLALPLVFLIVFAASLFICGNSESFTYEEDAIIVLGSGIRGEKLSDGLRRRLDRAVEYHRENPKAVIVVTGGQGPQEDITEALAMERYLLSRGIDPSKIIKEESATGTNENFRFSKRILDDHFGESYTVGFITTEYHIYRAGKIALAEGFENVTHGHCHSIPYTAFPGALREVFAIAAYTLRYLLG